MNTGRCSYLAKALIAEINRPGHDHDRLNNARNFKGQISARALPKIRKQARRLDRRAGKKLCQQEWEQELDPIAYYVPIFNGGYPVYHDPQCDDPNYDDTQWYSSDDDNEPGWWEDWEDETEDGMDDLYPDPDDAPVPTDPDDHWYLLNPI